MTGTHWMPPDIGGDILSEATRLDAAEAVAIHVRPEVHALICRQAGADPDTNSAGDSPYSNIAAARQATRTPVFAPGADVPGIDGCAVGSRQDWRHHPAAL